MLTSAKLGRGIGDVLERIAGRVPGPKVDVKAPLQVLIFDSYYDPYRGIALYMRDVAGILRLGDRIEVLSGEKKLYEVLEVGCLVTRENSWRGLLQAMWGIFYCWD